MYIISITAEYQTKNKYQLALLHKLRNLDLLLIKDEAALAVLLNYITKAPETMLLGHPRCKKVEVKLKALTPEHTIVYIGEFMVLNIKSIKGIVSQHQDMLQFEIIDENLNLHKTITDPNA